MPWRVDDVDVMIIPFTKCSRRLDRDTLFSLEVHRVHLCPHPILNKEQQMSGFNASYNTVQNIEGMFMTGVTCVNETTEGLQVRYRPTLHLHPFRKMCCARIGLSTALSQHLASVSSLYELMSEQKYVRTYVLCVISSLDLCVGHAVDGIFVPTKNTAAV